MPTTTKSRIPSNNGGTVAASSNPGAKPGYKHTKLGWIPEEWEIKPLGKCVLADRRITYGIVQPGGYDPTGRYLVRGKDYSFGWAEPEAFFRVTPKIEEPYKRSRLKAGDTLLTIVGAGVGNVAVVPEWLEGANITQTTARIAINPSQHEPAFFYHYLGSGMGLRLVHHFEKGGAQPGLNIEDINIFPIVCPPLPEQRRIAQVLGAWDRAIATVQQLLAAQQERKRGLMQELLTGRRRFKGFEGKWKNYRLGELFERITRKNDVGDSHVMTISAQHGLIDQREIFNKSVAGANLAAYYLLKKGEFAYNKSSSNGYPVGAIKRLERYEQGILSVLYICFGLKPGAANGDFMAAYFDAGLMDEGIGAIAQEGARNHGLLNVSTSDFFDIDVHIPQAEEQAVIAKAIGVLNKETESIQNYLDHLTTQKQGLMQQLLTGAVRVKC